MQCAEMLQRSIVSFAPNSWLLRRDDGELERVSVGIRLQAVGQFRRGDRVNARIDDAGHLIEIEHADQRTKPTFTRTALEASSIFRRPSIEILGRFPPREYDGMPIVCEENSKHELVRATAIDRNGVERELTLESGWAVQSDPIAILRYKENGYEIYVARMSVSRDFRLTVVFSDQIRSLNYEAALNRGQPLDANLGGAGPWQDAYIEINGQVFQRYGPVTEAWLSGTYQNGILNVDIDPATYMPDAMARAEYFGPLLVELPPTQPDPLANANNQTILHHSGMSSRDWGLVAFGSLSSFVIRLGCSAWEVWPWGTALCGLTTISTMVSSALASSTYLEPHPPNPPPKPPTPPTPPPTQVIPSPGSPSPFPFPTDCPGGCPPNQVCLAGKCIDLTGPTGDWGSGEWP
jgi:hypothetical protein